MRSAPRTRRRHLLLPSVSLTPQGGSSTCHCRYPCAYLLMLAPHLSRRSPVTSWHGNSMKYLWPNVSGTHRSSSVSNTFLMDCEVTAVSEEAEDPLTEFVFEATNEVMKASPGTKPATR